MTRITLTEALERKGKTDLAKLKASDPETEVDFDWAQAEIVAPKLKQMISLRLDPDVLEFFKAQGKGYQTRINNVLRSYMEAQK